MQEATQKPVYETQVVKPNISTIENEQTLRAITFEDELFLDAKISQIENLLATEHGLGKSEVEKDQLYYSAQLSWKEYVDRLKNMKFNFYLNRKQYNFLTTLLISKLEYDVNTVFLAIELTNMLGKWELSKTNKENKNDSEIKSYASDATEITYMYHLIATYKPKGLSADTYLFAEILTKIGFISKVISYYDNHAKSLNKDIQDWCATFEEGVYIEGKNWGRKEAADLGIVADKTKSKSSKSKKKEEEKA
jgi:hypothetical protein